MDIENADADFLKLRQEQSREYAARLNAQKNKGTKTNYTVKNTSSSSIKIITDSGSTTTLSAGGSTSYICSTDVYFCVGESSKGSLIANGDDACGSTVTIE
ncbi:MAG TPA: hypothetical protein EYG86_08545 [Crocinitomicaceae bacterium]|nr:hypothetical protein [Crocinitomicaceae bacterium]